MTRKLELLSATEIGSLVNNREVKPSEIIDYFFDRIAKYNPSINAFVYTRYDEAIAKAKELEKRLDRGEYVGPFAGVPFGLKDFLPSKKGWTHSKGGVRKMIEIDDHDSVFCEAMEKAGGIAIGKTNAPSFGFRGTTDNRLYGPSRNPFNTEYNTGGSSGGSAAAVASGFVPIAEGGDAGGSIRIPAGWTNLYGYKASIGTIPSVVRPDAWSATHPYCFNGGLTKTVQDAAILMNFMARYDPRDPMSIERPPIDFTKEMARSIKGWKIAFTYDFGVFEVEEDIKEMVFQAAKKFEKAGAHVDLVKFNLDYNLDYITKAWCQSISADTAIEFQLRKEKGFDVYEQCKDDIPQEFLENNLLAYGANMMSVYRFNLLRTNIFDAFQNVFDEYDLILSPLTGCHAVKNQPNGNTYGPQVINGKKVDPLIGFAETLIANFTGHPAASLPIGLGRLGTPLGMQIIGKRFHDGDVFAASKTFEDISPWKGIFESISLK